ncbi:MAG: hypothetical protein CBE07_001560 [Pelagibacteraceae bacterium TMED247]|nr:MAG: hypothetical protein CBE07_001560 [Pelagibacteraceae bacterium TMED247]
MGRDITLTRPKKRKSISSGLRTLFLYRGIKDKDGNEDFISDIDSEYLGTAKLPGYRQTSGDVVGITEAGEKDLIDGDIYKVRYYDILNLDSKMLKDYKRKSVKLEDGTDSYVYIYEPNKIFMEKDSRYMMLYRLLKISSAENFNFKKKIKKTAQGQTESYDIESLDELIDLINEDKAQLIFLDNPMGSYKKFGGNKKLKLPFDYGEYSELINPADDMGWDIIIVPSASGKYGKTITADKNDLIPVGLAPVNDSEADWEENTNGKKKPPVGNDKIILAPDGKYLDSDAKEIESFFKDLWQFKEIKWY